MNINVNQDGFSLGRNRGNSSVNVVRDWKRGAWGVEWSKRI